MVYFCICGYQMTKREFYKKFTYLEFVLNVLILIGSVYTITKDFRILTIILIAIYIAYLIFLVSVYMKYLKKKKYKTRMHKFYSVVRLLMFLSSSFGFSYFMESLEIV